MPDRAVEPRGAIHAQEMAFVVPNTFTVSTAACESALPDHRANAPDTTRWPAGDHRRPAHPRSIHNNQALVRHLPAARLAAH